MSKGWHGNKQAHSMASKGVKTKINSLGNRKYGWKVVWKQEDNEGKLKIYSEVFEKESKAKTHIQKLLISAESIDKPISIIESGLEQKLVQEER